MIVADSLWDHPNPHVIEFAVQPEDIDGLEHTNNTVYVKWCEQVAWAHSVALGLDLDCYRRLDRAMAIIDSRYRYLKASRESDKVAVGTWIVEWDGRLTMRREFQAVRVADGEILLRGDVRFVCIQISSGKPRRLPQEFIEGYGPAILTG